VAGTYRFVTKTATKQESKLGMIIRVFPHDSAISQWKKWEVGEKVIRQGKPIYAGCFGPISVLPKTVRKQVIRGNGEDTDVNVGMASALY
jgi:hypothetical protein